MNLENSRMQPANSPRALSPLTQRLPGSRLSLVSNHRLGSSRRLGAVLRPADLIDTLDNAKLSRHRRQSIQSPKRADNEKQNSPLAKALEDLKQEHFRRKSLVDKNLFSRSEIEESKSLPSPILVKVVKKPRSRSRSLHLSTNGLSNSTNPKDLSASKQGQQQEDVMDAGSERTTTYSTVEYLKKQKRTRQKSIERSNSTKRLLEDVDKNTDCKQQTTKTLSETAGVNRVRSSGKSVTEIPLSSSCLSNHKIVDTKPAEDAKTGSKWKRVNGTWAYPSKTTKSPARAEKTEEDVSFHVAAIHIQRLVRGGLQRLKFRIALLQFELDLQEARIAAELVKENNRVQRQKDRFLKKLMATAQANDDKVAQQDEAIPDSQQIIAFLRKENNGLRIKQ